MHGNADGTGLIRNSTGNRLANPPGRIGAEFIAPTIFKLIDRFHQADIALLNEVEKAQATVGIFLGNAHDQAEIGLGKLTLRFVVFLLTMADTPQRFCQGFMGGLGLYLELLLGLDRLTQALRQPLKLCRAFLERQRLRTLRAIRPYVPMQGLGVTTSFLDALMDLPLIG